MEKTGNEIGSPKSVSRNDRATRRRSMGVVGLMVAVVAFLATSGNPAGAATAPTLGTAKSFAVLAATTVTNTGPSVITGDLGVSPGLAVTGFPPGEVRNGTTRVGDAAADAQADALTAYNGLAGEACAPENNLTGRDLGGLTLTPGVYCFSTSAQLTGTLTLNAEGDPNAVFIFQIGSTLITAPDSKVVLINGANPCNVFWQVGSSATLDTNTKFVGTVIALQSITANTGADVEGRLLALNGAVTLDTNDVDASRCTTGTTTTEPDGTTSTTGVDGTTSTTGVDGTTTTVPVDGTTTTVPVDGTTTTVPVDGTTTTVPVDGTTSTTEVDTTTSTTELDTTTSTTELDTTTSTTEVAAARESGRGGLTGALRTGGHGMLPRTGTAAHTMTLTGVLAIVLGSLALLVADLRRPGAAGSSSPRGRARDHHQPRRRPWSWPWPSWAAGTKRSTWPRR